MNDHEVNKFAKLPPTSNGVHAVLEAIMNDHEANLRAIRRNLRIATIILCIAIFNITVAIAIAIWRHM